MKKHELIEFLFENGWQNCPMNPTSYRKVVGYDEDELPIVQEVDIGQDFNLGDFYEKYTKLQSVDYKA